MQIEKHVASLESRVTSFHIDLGPQHMVKRLNFLRQNFGLDLQSHKNRPYLQSILKGELISGIFNATLDSVRILGSFISIVIINCVCIR